MNGYETASRWIVDQFEGVDAGFRRDVLTTMRELAPTTSRFRRAVELLSLVALGWRLRSRARTAGARRAQWLQGVYLGGVLLGLVLAAQGWASAAEAAGAAAGTWSSAGVAPFAWAAAVASTGVVACGLAGCRVGTVCWAAVAVAADRLAQSGVGAGVGAGIEAGADGGAGVAVVAGYLVVVVAVVTGSAGPVRRCWVAAISVGCAPAASVALVAGVGSNAADLTLHVALSIVAPGLLLAAGTFDPRLAVAGTVIWFWGLGASAVAELAASLSVLSETGEHYLLVRWLVMSAGIALAFGLTRTNIRRLFEL